MPQQGITFDGAYIGLPGVYYADNVSAVGFTPNPVTPPMLVIGYGWGPKPKTINQYVGAQNFLNAVRGGPISAYIPFMATPSPQVNGAQRFTFIDVSTNTQATAALLASGGQTNTLMTSVLYGPPSNQLTYQLSTGTTAGRKLTLNDGYANTVLVGDNLTVPILLAYSGQATGGVNYTMVTGTTSGAFSINSPITGESVSIPLGPGAYNTTTDIVEFLNGTGFYYAQLLSATGGQLPALSLTATASVALPIPTSGALNYVNVNAYLQDIPFWINQFANSLASAAVSGSALDTSAWLPVTGAAVFFSGARGVPPTNSDYAAALTVGLSTPAWTVFCDSNATAVQALLAQHCEMCSQPPYSAWRRGFTGSSIGDTVSTTIVNSTNLDSYQMVYAFPGVYQTNTTTGQNQLYSGLYVAAAAAAMATGNQVAMALTNKVLNGTGVEQPGGSNLTNSQLVQLQNSGVMAIYTPQQTGVPTIVSDVTTWEADNNVENTSSQQVACRFWLAYNMIAALQPYVGSIAAPIIEVNILNAAKRMLNSLLYTGGASNGVLASWNSSSLQLIYNGANQLAAVSFSATLVSQNRYITEYADIEPLQFTISVAA